MMCLKGDCLLTENSFRVCGSSKSCVNIACAVDLTLFLISLYGMMLIQRIIPIYYSGFVLVSLYANWSTHSFHAACIRAKANICSR